MQNMPLPLAREIAGLQPGAISAAPIESGSQRYFVKLDAVRPMQVPAFDAVKPAIKQALGVAELERAAVQMVGSLLKSTKAVQSFTRQVHAVANLPYMLMMWIQPPSRCNRRRLCRTLWSLLLAWLSLATPWVQAEEADMAAMQDPLYVELSTCLMGSLTQHAIAQERRNGVSIEVQRQRYRAQVGENALMEQFLTQLYATDDPSALLVDLNSRCVANMVGVPEERAAACYRQFMLPLYTAIMEPHEGGIDTATPKASYLACMRR